MTLREGSDPADELVDIVDDDDIVVMAVPRRRLRAERLRHRVVFVVVVGGDGRLLVHRRSADKDLWPGHWDVAAGGVVASSEGWIAAAERELGEELGVAGPLVEVGRGRFDDAEVAEIARCYRIVHDGPFELRDGEVAEVRWVDRTELAELQAEEPFVPDSRALLDPNMLFPLPPPADTQEG